MSTFPLRKVSGTIVETPCRYFDATVAGTERRYALHYVGYHGWKVSDPISGKGILEVNGPMGGGFNATSNPAQVEAMAREQLGPYAARVGHELYNQTLNFERSKDLT